MPELPEVETIKRALEKQVVGKIIKSAESNFPKLVAQPDFRKFQARIKNKKIESLSRRGKFLIFYLSGSKVLISHLRMTGHWLVGSDLKKEKFIHLNLKLNDSKILAYSDIRKFGRIWLVDKNELADFIPWSKLGPEPLSKEFTWKVFVDRLGRHKATIKQMLLNQEVVAGLGNIYVDEVLFKAGINPHRFAKRLTVGEKLKIFRAIKTILALAIKHSGTTVVNFTTPEGGSGHFQKHLKVYGKKGNRCPRCKGKIKRIVVAGRGTHYCPKCQK